MPFSASRHVVSLIRFSHHGINYSVLPSCRMPFSVSRHVVSIIRFSHHVGCRLVHPDTWYQLFGSPIMSDAVWCTPTRGFNYSVSHHAGCRLVHPDTWYQLFGSPIMSDAIWCTPTRGINYSVSHHAGCRLVHLDTWYQLNVIRHHDGCRLVHPAKWDISSMPYAIMTDADWCIPPSGTLDNFGVPL